MHNGIILSVRSGFRLLFLPKSENNSCTILVEITTLENVIYLHMKNDISFLIDHDLNLYEHQSSFNPNMPYDDAGAQRTP